MGLRLLGEPQSLVPLALLPLALLPLLPLALLPLVPLPPLALVQFEARLVEEQAQWHSAHPQGEWMRSLQA
mgnify:CR=1 FL=1